MKRSNRVMNLIVVALLLVAALALAGCEESKLLGVNGPAPAPKLAGTWIPSSGDQLVFQHGGDAYYGEKGDNPTFTWHVKDKVEDTKVVFVDQDGNERIQAFELGDDDLTLTLYESENAGGSSVRYTKHQVPAPQE